MNDFSAELGGLIVAFGGGTYSLIAIETDAGIMVDFLFLNFFLKIEGGLTADWLLIKNIYPIKKFSDKILDWFKISFMRALLTPFSSRARLPPFFESLKNLTSPAREVFQAREKRGEPGSLSGS
jgi:hypothetical protein